MTDKSGVTESLAGSGESLGELLKMAVVEINILNVSGFLPARFDGSRISLAAPISVFSFAGKDLYRRVFLERRSADKTERVGFFEFAVDSIYGGILLAVGIGEGTIRGAALGEREIRGVLISMTYPKVAFRLESASGEGLFELSSGQEVQEGDRPLSDALGFLDIRDLRDTLSPVELRKRSARFEQEKSFLSSIVEMGGSRGFDFGLISKEEFSNLVEANGLAISKDFDSVSRDSVEAGDLRLVGQSLNEWCFPASLQMFFDFYRFVYNQDAIAYVLHLDPERGQELPKSTEFDVVSAIEKMTRGGIVGKMIRTPEWPDFQREILRGGPAIGLIDGHCRLVIGTNIVNISGEHVGRFILQGLALLDPWPVDSGTRICWENFDAITYVAMFGGELNILSEVELGLVDAVRLKVNALLTTESKIWRLPEGARVAGIERLSHEQNKQVNKDGWIAGVEGGDKLLGFVELDNLLDFKKFYEPRDLDHATVTAQFLDRKLVREKAKKTLGSDKRLGRLTLAIEDSSELHWKASEGTPEGKKDIVLDRLEIKPHS